MKKRILSVILTITLVFSLSACGNGKTKENEISTQTESEIRETNIEETSEEDKNTETESGEKQSEISKNEDTQSDDTQNEDTESGNDPGNTSGSNDSKQNINSNTSGSANNGNQDSGNGSSNNTSSNNNSSNNTSSDNTNSNSSNSNSSNSNNSDSSNNVNNNAGSGNNTGSNTEENNNTGSPVETVYVSAFSKKENELADEVIAEILNTSMGEFAMVKAIHDYLVMHVDYDYQSYMNYVNGSGDIPNASHKAEGALANQYAVCDGYSYAFQLLCVKAGISCEVVSGTAMDVYTGSKVSHAWNQVKIEGNWYNVDVTWDDPALVNDEVTTLNDHSGNSYEYFCIPDSTMYIDHTEKNAKHTCTSASLVERALKAGIPWDDAVYAASESELAALIKSETQEGNNNISFYIKKSVVGDDIGNFCGKCVSQAGIKYSQLSMGYYTYSEGTADPGTYYRITIKIQ